MENARQNGSKQPNILFIGLFLLYVFEVVRTAWISDDAMITLRTVLNFIHGYGPTYNIDERVQAYTHPLWFLVLSLFSWITGDVFVATFFCSILLSVVAYFVFLKRYVTGFDVTLISALVLLLSKAFIEYSSSGLENPLSYLIVILLIIASERVLVGKEERFVWIFFLLLSLLYLNRADLLLLVLPVFLQVCYSYARRPWFLARSMALGAGLVLAWTSFSLYYYGYMVPNTAFAKLGAGVPLQERIVQGLRYVMDSIDRDPLTIAVIVFGVVAGLYHSVYGTSMALGVLIYLLYVIVIGGDFMTGRFFSVPLLVSVAQLNNLSGLGRNQIFALGVLVLLLGSIGLKSTLYSGSSYDNHVVNGYNGIADERGYYYQSYSLLQSIKTSYIIPDWNSFEKKVGVIGGGLGNFGLSNGPGMHCIDNLALADPLLSHMKADYDCNWRIGHFERHLPEGYQESIALNRNVIADRNVRDYYDTIRLITRGRLNDPARIQAITDMNFLGKYPDLVAEADRHKNAVPYERLGHVVDGGSWDAPGNVVIGKKLEITVSRPLDVGSIDVSFDWNDLYAVDALVGDEYRRVVTVLPLEGGKGMVRHKYRLYRTIRGVRGFRVVPLDGDDSYSIGHLIVNGD